MNLIIPHILAVPGVRQPDGETGLMAVKYGVFFYKGKLR